MDLDLSELGLLQFTRDNDRAAGGVNFDSPLKGGLRRKDEELAEHLHHVIVSVVVIIEQNDMEERSEFLALSGFLLRNNCGRHQLRW